MNKRQAKKLELKNKISDIKKDYKIQEMKIDALNNINNKFLNEKEKLMYEFKKQEQLLKANKESLANVIHAQSYLEIENSKRMAELSGVIRKQNEHIHILEYGLVGIIIFIAMLLIEVILWYL